MEGNLVVALNALLIRTALLNFHRLASFVAAGTFIIPAALTVAAASGTIGNFRPAQLQMFGTSTSTLSAYLCRAAMPKAMACLFAALSASKKCIVPCFLHSKKNHDVSCEINWFFWHLPLCLLTNLCFYYTQAFSVSISVNFAPNHQMTNDCSLILA